MPTMSCQLSLTWLRLPAKIRLCARLAVDVGRGPSWRVDRVQANRHRYPYRTAQFGWRRGNSRVKTYNCCYCTSDSHSTRSSSRRKPGYPDGFRAAPPPDPPIPSTQAHATRAGWELNGRERGVLLLNELQTRLDPT